MSLRIHVIKTGTLVGNESFYRGEGWSSLLRPRKDVEFPAYSFVIERPEGLILIDTGLGSHTRSPRPRIQRRFVPDPQLEREIGPAMRELDLDPADVRRVILTHLDWDHAGGLAHFPQAEVLLHRPEHEFAQTFPGRQRFEPQHWPQGFGPSLYDLDPDPYGPFPQSKVLTDDGELRLVPLSGHTPGQVGVIVERGDERLLFSADHILRQDWFYEDLARGNSLGLGIFFAEQARETSQRIQELADNQSTILIPSHDAETPARLLAQRATVYAQ